MNTTRTYNSKILLFGEYTVLHGSKALAIPYKRFTGKWIFDKNHTSRIEIAKLKNYLLKIYREGKLDNFDFDDLERQLSNGLAFESNIPQGYGVGSSGSVTAAIFDAFMKKENLLTTIALKDSLALIESCYHGSSSGIDPLVSYLSQPILIHNKEKIELLDTLNKNINKNLFLLDTGIKRRTAPLVQAYLQTRKESESFIMKMQDIASINDDLIDAYLRVDQPTFDQLIKDLSKAQYQNMQMLIPAQHKDQWQQGIESGNYSMKLNGAGGGGFIMIYNHTGMDLTHLDLIPIV